MPLTPEAARAEKVREARTTQVIETLCEVFGNVSIEVMFLAISRWFGQVIFNGCQTPVDRREVLKRFVDQIEDIITKQEKDTK